MAESKLGIKKLRHILALVCLQFQIYLIFTLYIRTGVDAWGKILGHFIFLHARLYRIWLSNESSHCFHGKTVLRESLNDKNMYIFDNFY